MIHKRFSWALHKDDSKIKNIWERSRREGPINNSEIKRHYKCHQRHKKNHITLPLSMAVNIIFYKICHCYWQSFIVGWVVNSCENKSLPFQGGRDIIELNWNQVTLISWKNGTNGEFVKSLKIYLNLPYRTKLLKIPLNKFTGLHFGCSNFKQGWQRWNEDYIIGTTNLFII